MIVQYKHKFDYCVYLSHIKIKISEVIIIPKDTDSSMVSERNKNNTADHSFH